MPCFVVHNGNAENKAVVHSLEAAESAFDAVDKIKYLLLFVKAYDNHKNICCQSAEWLVSAANNVHRIGKEPEQLIARIIAVILIYELEALNVKLYESDVFIGIILYKFSDYLAVNCRIFVGRKAFNYLPVKLLFLCKWADIYKNGSYPALVVL